MVAEDEMLKKDRYGAVAGCSPEFCVDYPRDKLVTEHRVFFLFSILWTFMSHPRHFGKIHEHVLRSNILSTRWKRISQSLNVSRINVKTKRMNQWKGRGQKTYFDQGLDMVNLCGKDEELHEIFHRHWIHLCGHSWLSVPEGCRVSSLIMKEEENTCSINGIDRSLK